MRVLILSRQVRFREWLRHYLAINVLTSATVQSVETPEELLRELEREPGHRVFIDGTCSAHEFQMLRSRLPSVSQAPEMWLVFEPDPLLATDEPVLFQLRLETRPGGVAPELAAAPGGEVARRAGEDESTGRTLRLDPPVTQLTRRQIEVLRLLAQGSSVKEVARQLKLSVKAVDSHKYRIMQQLCIHDRVKLARYAIRTGLVTP